LQYKITKRTVDSLSRGKSIADNEVKGFSVRHLPSGIISYGYRYRNRKGKQRWLSLGLHGQITPDQARALAKKAAGEVASGGDPVEERDKEKSAATSTLKAVCEDYLTRECGMKRDAEGKATFEGGNIRSGDQRLSAFERLVYPTLGNWQIDAVKRSQVVKLLDTIEDEHGPSMAHSTLAYLSKVFNWHASRTDDFQSPLVRGMGRVKPRERAGTRVLADDEMRDVWAALDASANDIPACFAKLVRTLLLTAVRRTEAARMSWPEIEGDLWTVPGSRMKGKLDHVVPLTPAVRAIIGERPKDAKARPFVFSTTGGKKPFSGYSKAKAALDREIAKLRKNDGRDPMPAWQLSRDLRRTSKTLMARAGVRPDISERVLAHVIPGVEGIYDRYEYAAEKREALEKLAALIERILNPPAGDNITPLRRVA
jgi:integrase